ncbi:MAG: PIN domain-containing protein, partial [Planctomycetaceae bacterium]|nr:PIN domain-containing protein [Planctomycetaceae bacterium]
MTFVDTSAWYASVVPDDENHQAATAWLNGNSQPLSTTDYVVDETLTLLKMRGHASVAFELGTLLSDGQLAEVELVTEDDIQQAWRTFRHFRDKDWSFTDCTSKVVME